MPSLSEAVQSLAPMFAGRLLQSSDPTYDDARRLHNGMIDRRPSLIAQCRGTADVADAIKLARTQGLPLSVRGGGHNVAGHACADRGLMLDLSLMRGVHVNPRTKTAWVDGGATWRETNRETQHFGLAVTGGVISSTGVAGLTLGGGFGWLMPKFGLALDNLRAATVVLADGTVVHPTSTNHADLFWAIRGGGGNFGVVSSFEFQLHDVGPMITAGLVVHPFSEAKALLRFCRDQAPKLSDDVFMVGGLVTAPDGSGTKMAAIAVAHCGSLQAGEAGLRPFKAFGTPVMDVVGPMPYTAANMMLDNSAPRGARNYWKSNFIDTLTDEAIDVLVDQFDRIPSPMCQLFLEHVHGAATRVPVADTAFAMRRTGFNCLVLGQWADPRDDEKGIAWARETHAALHPFVGPRRYVNYLYNDDANLASLEAAYGPNLPRLRQLKAKYDPENVFKLNVNISPA